jgi:hypothetical protein
MAQNAVSAAALPPVTQAQPVQPATDQHQVGGISITSSAIFA